MALSDLKNRLMQMFSPGTGDGTRRPDGGTSCYRPMRKRMPPDAAGPQNYDYAQPVQYVHTGFTGMTPPSGYGGDGSGFGPQQGFAQTGYAPSAYEQPVYEQPMFPRGDGFPQQGAFGGFEPFSQPSGSQPFNLFQGRPDPEERTAARPERGWFPSRDQARQPDNISYMPGFAPDSAAIAQHVEHIMTLTGLKSCYEAIECMKNGETLIVMLDAIANEGESMRCQDMLAGAAFTLGCSVRMLQGGRLVLIAPDGVRILPEQQAVRQEFPPAFMQATQKLAPQNAEPVKRERRVNPRAEEWNAARNGQMEQYNPYTGTMPVAAGAYGNFGGYGY